MSNMYKRLYFFLRNCKKIIIAPAINLILHDAVWTYGIYCKMLIKKVYTTFLHFNGFFNEQYPHYMKITLWRQWGLWLASWSTGGYYWRRARVLKVLLSSIIFVHTGFNYYRVFHKSLMVFIFYFLSKYLTFCAITFSQVLEFFKYKFLTFHQLLRLSCLILKINPKPQIGYIWIDMLAMKIPHGSKLFIENLIKNERNSHDEFYIT